MKKKGTSNFITYCHPVIILVTMQTREDKFVLQIETRGIRIKIKIHASHLPFQGTAHI